MLSEMQIERLLDSGSHGRLVRRVLGNGRCDRAEIVERLAGDGAAATSGLGLALQRVLELSYGTSPVADRIVRRLVARRTPRGLLAESPGDDVGSIVGTVVAVRGLLEWCDRQRDLGLEPAGAVRDVVEDGLEAIGAHAACGRLGDTIDATIVLWQLVDRCELRAVLDPDLLVATIDDAARGLAPAVGAVPTAAAA